MDLYSLSRQVSQPWVAYVAEADCYNFCSLFPNYQFRLVILSLISSIYGPVSLFLEISSL